MKIASIALKNFRVYDSAEVSFDQPLCIIRGINHSGKSSVAQAIQIALAKRSEGTNAKGDGAMDKVRGEGAKAEIVVGIDGKAGPVDVRVTYGPNKTGRNQFITSDNDKVPEAFEKFLNQNNVRLSCVLDTGYFVAQKDEEQKAILAALVLPATHNFDANMVLLAEKHLGAFQWTKPPVALIEQAYDAAYSARKSAKATLGGIFIGADPRVPEYSATAVQEKLAELRAKAAKETKRKPAGTVQIGRVQQQIETAEKAIKVDDDTIGAEGEKIKDLKALMLDPAEVKKHEKIAGGKSIFDTLQEQIEVADGEASGYQDAREAFEELLENPHCPTCTQVITPEFIQAKVVEFIGHKKESLELIANFQQQQKSLGDITGSEKLLTAHRQRQEEITQRHENINQAKTRISEQQVKLVALKADLEEAQKLEAEPVDTSALDALTAEIATWEERLTPALTYVSGMKANEDARARKTAQTTVVSELESLCAYFGKDGVKATLIKEHVGGFTTTVNSVLKTWGYEARLEIEPYEFLVKQSEQRVNGTLDRWLPLKELSGSEQMMFGAALQTAVAIHSNIRMVLIDKADTFVGAERKRLLGCVYKLTQGKMLDQAIVLESNESIEAPKQDGVAFYRTWDGKVEHL